MPTGRTLKMRLTRLPLPPSLRRIVHQMWIAENDCGLPAGNLRTVVPNGRTRLILPLRRALTATGGGSARTLGEGQAGLVGQWDMPAVLSAPVAPLVTLGWRSRRRGSRFSAANRRYCLPGPSMPSTR